MENRATSVGENAAGIQAPAGKPPAQSTKGSTKQKPATTTTTGRRPRKIKGQGRTAEVEGIS